MGDDAHGPRFRFAVDRGGTFTDVYAEVQKGDNVSVHVSKLLSVDPSNYDDAPTEGIRRVLEAEGGGMQPRGERVDTSRIDWIRMGTTVATNALLERRGERCAFVVTKGLRDVLRIGNQSRPKIFDLRVRRPGVLYDHVIEVDERVQIVGAEDVKAGDGGDGARKAGMSFKVLRRPDLEQLRADLLHARDELHIKSVAVALVHSYAFPEHELQAGRLAEELGFEHVSLSSQLTPMVKLTPRGFTACVDAYLTPKIDQYLRGFSKGFQDGLRDTRVEFMQSDGGLCDTNNFTGYRSILSGPAGGVVGYSRTAYTSAASGSDGVRPVIGFDMGGTSTDVSRYAGELEHIFETETAGVTIQAPQLDIHTVAAGGGSRLFYRSGLFVVGPESVGAHPGPVCYRKDGHLAVTDANLRLGRLIPEHFPHIFGPNADEPLDVDATCAALDKLTKEINEYEAQHRTQASGGGGETKLSTEDVALGFIRVANEAMCRPIRSLTEAKGFEIRQHILSCFGGAGGQHACAVARSLGIDTVYVHRYCGVLSAYGIGVADTVVEMQSPLSLTYNDEDVKGALQKLDELEKDAHEKLTAHKINFVSVRAERFLHLRYEGTDFGLMVQQDESGDFKTSFERIYKQEHGFAMHDREILVDDARVRVIGAASEGVDGHKGDVLESNEALPVSATRRCYFHDDGWTDTDVLQFSALKPGMRIVKPSMIIDTKAGVTVLIEPKCKALVTADGDLRIHVPIEEKNDEDDDDWVDPIQLSLFGHRFMGIAEQMGKTLQRTATSTNIKERLDFSCAIFDDTGGLVANAPHVPVHLGSMQDAVRYQVRLHGREWKENEVILTNHPDAGGSHLPDVTIITPVYHGEAPLFYVASRGHQSDIGGLTPGSMPPFSVTLAEEGLAVKSFKLVEGGNFQEQGLRELLAGSGCRQTDNVVSDIRAQVAANRKGITLVEEMIAAEGEKLVLKYMKQIQATAALSVRDMLRRISHERRLNEVDTLTAEDRMDNGLRICLALHIDRRDGTAMFDFTGTDSQVYGNLNAPRAVSTSAVIYALRCLVDEDIPLNQGCLEPVRIELPENSLLLPSADAAVVGGNVLTSQRLTDVILRAFGAAAASQGCMNNFTFGNHRVGYYETIAGGAGAGPGWHGESGVHTHMTNTRITDVEILERRYAVLLRSFHLREGSGGSGRYRGGEGVVRELEMLEPMSVSILSERRVFAPWGLAGGGDARCGSNYIVRASGREIFFGGKNTTELRPGDRIRICTPGGGGYGAEEQSTADAHADEKKQSGTALSAEGQ